MTTLTIAYYTLLRNLRDVKSMLNMILMPVLLILILGNALGSAFEVKGIGATNVAFVDNDKSEIAAQFERFIGTDEIKEIITTQNYGSYEEAIKVLNEGKVAAIITLDKGMTEKVHSGEKISIKIYEGSNSSFRALIVKNVVESFTNGANTIMAKMAIGGNPNEYLRKEIINNIPLSAKGKIPGAMDYYAVTMMVLIIMYGSLYAIHGVGEDYLDNMGNRLRSTPVSLSSHFAGKILGTVFTVYLQTLLLIAFTKFVYRANWGSNLLEIIFISFTLTVFSVSLGLMITMIAKERKIATAIVSTIIPIMTFISGGYIRIITDNPVYNSIKLLMPSSLGQTAFFNSIYGDFAGQTVISIILLWVMITVMSGITVIAGRRRLS